MAVIDEFFDDVFNPSKHPVRGFFFAFYLTAISSSGLTDLIFNYFGEWLESQFELSPILFRTLLTLFIPFIAFVVLLRSKWFQWRNRQAIAKSIKPKPLMGTYPGLIVTMSLRKDCSWENTPAAQAFQHHWAEGRGKLTHCWIICFGQQLELQARNMIWSLALDGQKVGSGQVWNVTNALNRDRRLRVSFIQLDGSDLENPNVMFECVNGIYKEARGLGLAQEEIIADFQGGNKSMTAGMILACATPTRRLECLSPKAKTQDGRADYSAGSVVTYVEVSYAVKPLPAKKVGRPELGE